MLPSGRRGGSPPRLDHPLLMVAQLTKEVNLVVLTSPPSRGLGLTGATVWLRQLTACQVLQVQLPVFTLARLVPC